LGQVAAQLKFDDQFSSIPTGEKHVYGIGGFVQAFDDRFLVLDLSEYFPLAELSGGFDESRGVVQNNEALHLEALDEDGAKAGEAGVLLGVARDETAEDDAAVQVHARENSVHDFAADVFEINVDAMGSGGGQFFLPVWMFVVDSNVKAEVLRDPRAFVVATCDANDVTSVDFAKLPNDTAGCAGRGRDDKSFAFLGLGDFHTKESSETVDAENAQECGVRHERDFRNFLECAGVRGIEDCVVLEASEAHDAVAFLVIGVSRIEDFGEAEGAHDFADGDGGEITIHGNPDAHGGIHGEVFDFEEGLAVLELRDRRFDQLEIARREEAFGASVKQELTIVQGHFCPPKIVVRKLQELWLSQSSGISPQLPAARNGRATRMEYLRQRFRGRPRRLSHR